MFVTLTCTRFERSLSPVLDVLHEWLVSWSGIGVIERGMARILPVLLLGDQRWPMPQRARSVAAARRR